MLEQNSGKRHSTFCGRKEERDALSYRDGLAMGWKNGECIVASRVSPDRALASADKLAAIKTARTWSVSCATIRHRQRP
jgi:hypothetical protein